MNKEIKEILKILKKCEFGACITKHNSRVLLDYITNLEQENERLKKKCYLAHKMIYDNYGVLDKYQIDMLDDILTGGDEE